MERPCQLDEAVGYRLLTVQRRKVVVVEVVHDLEAQAVLGEGVAPEVYGPDGLPDLLDQRDGLGGEVALLLLPGCALTPSHYPINRLVAPVPAIVLRRPARAASACGSTHKHEARPDGGDIRRG